VARRLRFLDEFGVHLGLTRTYGRAAPGERVVEGTPGYSGPHYTVVAALGPDGVRAPLLLEGAMNGVAFETYVERVLGPSLHRGDVVVMDNLSAHTGDAVRALIEARGAGLVFLPPYSPDLNPIETCWSKVKAALRTAEARTPDELLDALCDALRAVSRDDVVAWFAHCGYSVNA
jgi:transposase